jgi:peptidoglycan-associated lipoprotein
MRFGTWHVGPLTAAAVGLVVAACGPEIKYPSCDTDADCKTNAEGTGVDEYCVNQKCQECREDTHCDAGQECKSGRCEAKSECPCDEPLICQLKKCVQPECVTDEDCSDGKKCESNTCMSAGCTADQECGAGMTCNNGVCEQAGVDKISAACRPMEAGGGDVIAMRTVTFEFDKADLSVQTRKALDENAECMRQAPGVTIVVEGHCDDRGTQEYNLGLGERRSNAVMSYLSNLGIETDRMRTVSKGKNEPVCRQATDSCYAKNRRVKFIQSR